MTPSGQHKLDSGCSSSSMMRAYQRLVRWPVRITPTRLTYGFTLVELLVVVSILLLVAVIALPSVGSLSKSAARRAAVSQAMGVLDQARTVALSQSSAVYVVFATDSTAIPEPYRYCSYAVFREVFHPEHRDFKPNGTKAEPYFLEVVRPWSKLPEGIAFLPPAAQSSSNPPSSTEKTVFDGPKDVFPFRIPNGTDAASGQTVDLPYFRFNSMGLLEEQTKPGKTIRPVDSSRVRLFEGFIQADGKPVRTNAARAISDEIVILSPVTGRARREGLNGGGA